MICRRCGNRIPENLAARESFRCPNCGRQFGTPVQEERPSFNFDDQPRRSRFAEDDARDFEPVRASGSRFADAYYDDQPDDNYYDEQSYSDDGGYYDEQAYSDDGGYYDEQPYSDDDGYYDDQPYSDDDGYYDEQAYSDDDGYYDEQAYSDDDGYYDEQPYSDDENVDLSGIAASDDQPAPGMKLTTIIFALILEATALIAVFGISLFL